MHAWLKRLQCALLSIYANESRGSFLLVHVLGDVWMLFNSLSLSQKKKPSMMHFVIFPCIICVRLYVGKVFFLHPCACTVWVWHVCECGCVHLCFINTSFLCVHLSSCLCVWWRAEPTRQTTTKRRKRKNSASSASNSSLGNSAGGKKRSPANNFNLTSQVPVSIKSSSLPTHTL